MIKDKFDTAAANKILCMESNQILAIHADLLPWIQDMNWPVAPIVFKALQKCFPELLKYLSEPLNSKDEEWIINLLELINSSAKKGSLSQQLIQTINNLKNLDNPTMDVLIAKITD